MGIKSIFVVGMVITSILVMSSIALTPTTALQASSKGLKLYLTVDTNLDVDVRIYGVILTKSVLVNCLNQTL